MLNNQVFKFKKYMDLKTIQFVLMLFKKKYIEFK